MEISRKTNHQRDPVLEWWKYIGVRANSPNPIEPFIVLRIAFGLVMAAGMIRFMARGWIRELYVDPIYHFTYAGFGWVRPLPEAGLWAVFIGLTVLAFMIAGGLAYRWSMAGFFLLFSYVELLDKATYLNHYYFVSLLSFLLIFLPLNGRFSLDAYLGFTERRLTIPAWMVAAVRLQIGLVYFFAGVAKINPDWLWEAQPLQIWLQARTGLPLIGPWLGRTWVAYVMSWTGMLFDLTIPFWLSWPKSRPFAYAAVVGFHLLTGWLFNIGMFPWLMIGCTLVFFDGALLRRIEGGPSRRWGRSSVTKAGSRSAAAAAFIGVYLTVQLILPLRHWAIPGDVNWTEEGGRFAWRVMLVEKTGHVTYFVEDEASGREWLVLPGEYLTDFQESQMSFQPDMIVQFAHFIESRYEAPVAVRAEAYVSWNGRSSRLLLDPDINLLQHKRPPILP